MLLVQQSALIIWGLYKCMTEKGKYTNILEGRKCQMLLHACKCYIVMNLKAILCRRRADVAEFEFWAETLLGVESVTLPHERKVWDTQSVTLP